MTRPEQIVQVYDRIAEGYDALWMSPSDEKENQVVAGIIASLRKGGPSPSVLDVGCGTGLALDIGITTPKKYVGIDQSAAMLGELMRKHPSVRTIYRSPASDILPLLLRTDQRFDLVLALFASASYLDPDDWMTMLGLVNGGGSVVLMTYEPGYLPDYWTGAEREAMLRQVSARHYEALALSWAFPHRTMHRRVGRFLLTVIRSTR